ncbi:MAG: response regulator [Syntrophotalea acetylenica]|jgi:two-component system chemotaxis response regulator CheY|uniref:Two-component system response regulator n=1 Tax=Syntrophotalea acetylenica TaxID=29542 RepID=A0A1L3GCX6_SYNAC|nr:response regulator [Syntrophotalea acetylenica]APG23695.1 two-component system response regulator [Syntrophotalea acetylenica]APG44272.1 two-component system response regulator [Syntrophotalea acetylenica]MDD4456681.1 response regulator [Syntrophotalea acetylenica]
MGKKVLIVDDSNTMRKIVARSLRQAGFEFEKLLEAADGQAALEILAGETVDIVLSDINMPVMDGIEFLRQKNADAQIKAIPVVMITTEAGTDVLNEALSLGAVGTIKKPFTPEQVQEVLGNFL